MTGKLSLIHDGVDMLDYSVRIRSNVARAATAWQDFTTLDQRTKEQFTATSLQSGTGYEKKGSGERESHDIKENFDITRASLSDLAMTSHTNPIASHFISAAGELFDDLERLITAEGKRIEKEYAVVGFAKEAATSASSAFVRFLYYPPVPTGTVIGEPHVDHSGFTFHLYESTDGCERLALDTRKWQPMPVSTEQAALFASMQTQLFSNGRVKGLCHRILANDTTARVGRSSIVCFIPLINMPTYDRKTHGRLQEMEPGFNYDISTAQFRNYFK